MQVDVNATIGCKEGLTMPEHRSLSGRNSITRFSYSSSAHDIRDDGL